MKPDKTGKVRYSKIVKTRIESGSLETNGCNHLLQIQDVTPSAKGCEDCLKMGDEWLFLRICLTCGYVGCCDNSKNKHATAHYHATGHPMISSFEPNEAWLWCYPDEGYFEI